MWRVDPLPEDGNRLSAREDPALQQARPAAAALLLELVSGSEHTATADD